jgi:hypothetical protein
MNVNSLLEGASPLQHQQAESAKLAAKWEKSGLLEGLNAHESEKTNMAVLLENQARQLVNESNTTGTGTSITAGAGEQWAGVALPLVRRVFGEIVAKDLVSVQPMNLPSGLIFYLDFQYGSSTQTGFTAADSLYNAGANEATDLPDAGKTGGLYGAGRFGYSINDTSSVVAALGTSADALSSYTTASVVGADYNFNTEWSASHAGQFQAANAAGVCKVIVDAADGLVDFDPEGVRAFELAGGTTAILEVFNEFTKVNGDNIEFLVSSSDLDNLGALTVTYHKGPDNINDRGDFEETDFSVGGSIDIPSIDVKLNSDTVTAKTRKLKAQWTPEFAQDLNAYHSIDAEAELTSILSEYISMEIDLEILDMLIRNADTTNHWSAEIAKEVTDAGVTTAENNSQYYTKLQSVSNTIHQKTLRGGANFMVVSPKVSTVLESIPGFAADSPGDSNKYAMGVQKIGAINSRYTVYKNPYMTENVILMGYKGNQFLETGAVFAPYIPLIMTPLVYDPVSFTPRKGIMTRYAKKMVRPDFYGKVICHDLNLV